MKLKKPEFGPILTQKLQRKIFFQKKKRKKKVVKLKSYGSLKSCKKIRTFLQAAPEKNFKQTDKQTNGQTDGHVLGTLLHGSKNYLEKNVLSSQSTLKKQKN